MLLCIYICIYICIYTSYVMYIYIYIINYNCIYIYITSMLGIFSIFRRLCGSDPYGPMDLDQADQALGLCHHVPSTLGALERTRPVPQNLISNALNCCVFVV